MGSLLFAMRLKTKPSESFRSLLSEHTLCICSFFLWLEYLSPKTLGAQL